MKRPFIVGFSIALLIVGVALYSRSKAACEAAGHNAYLCADNLRVIEATKELYAKDHGLKPGDVVGLSVLTDLHAWPRKCPSGGNYTINPVGTDPTCSIPGHRIPSDDHR
jgi:hypothetical protein